MWSDNDIDNAFRRLDPAEPEPTPFPLDAWLKLESKLDEAVIARAVRRRLWQFFAAEVAAVLLVALGWNLWPTASPARHRAPTLAAAPVASPAATAAAAAAGVTLNKSASSLPVRHPAAPREALAVSAAPETVQSLHATSSGVAHAGGQATAAARAVPGALAAASRSSAAEAPGLAARPLVRSLGPLSRHARLAKGLAARSGAAGRLARAEQGAGRMAGDPLGRPVPAGESAAATAVSSVSVAASAAARATATSISTVSSAASASSGAAARHSSLTQPGVGRATTGGLAGNAATEGARPAGRARGAAVVAAASHASDARPSTAAGYRAGRPGAASAAAPDATAATAASATAGAATVGASASVGAGLADDLSLLPASVVSLAAPLATELPLTLALVAVEPAAALPPPVRQSWLYLGLEAAPDVSTVKFGGAGPACLNLGLTLDVRLGRRLRLSTGVLRSAKQYVARREDYDWGAYPGRVYSRNFSDVNGACTVLDVPLNLRYDLLVRPGYRLVSTVGLSSFFMQHEKYNYDWTDATGPHTWTITAVNENQHLLSILNLALGAEYGLGTRWSLLAEPYVKLPLAGVGVGKVKLTSAGVYLGVKYGF